MHHNPSLEYPPLVTMDDVIPSDPTYNLFTSPAFAPFGSDLSSHVSGPDKVELWDDSEQSLHINQFSPRTAAFLLQCDTMLAGKPPSTTDVAMADHDRLMDHCELQVLNVEDAGRVTQVDL